MTKKEFITEYMKYSDCNIVEANKNVDNFIKILELGLSIDEEVCFRNFGRFKVKHIPERRGVDPNTLLPVTYKKMTKICFYPSDNLKNRLKNEV